jgi:hypothetical protein
MDRMTSRNLDSNNSTSLHQSSHHRSQSNRKRFVLDLNFWTMSFKMMDLLIKVCDVEKRLQ